MKITLTKNDIALARFVAEQRNRDGERANADANKFGEMQESTFAIHLIGCVGELAFAKAMNLFWTGASDHYRDDTDVNDFDVRATKHQNGSLLVRPCEGNEFSTWVLVVLDNKSLTAIVAGWALGHEVKQEKYKRSPANRQPAFFMPQSDLRPAEGLQLLVNRGLS